MCEHPCKPAWVIGWEAGASTVTGILTDLITELWGMAENSDHLTEWIGPSLERAERQLGALDLADRSRRALQDVAYAGDASTTSTPGYRSEHREVTDDG